MSRIVTPPEEASSLLDVVDRAVDRGVVVTGNLQLGMAGVDLIGLDLSTVLYPTGRLLVAPRRQAPLAGPAEPLPPMPRLPPMRRHVDVDDVERSLVQLVLSLVEFLHQLLERQALRRMEQGSLTPTETEALGRGLMQLERAIRLLARRFDLSLADLNLDLGPLGRLT